MRRLRSLAVLTLALGCTGKIQSKTAGPGASAFGDPSDPAVQACTTAPIDVPEVGLQRMTASQYLATERVIFGAPALDLALDFTDSNSPIITELEVDKLNDAAPVAAALGTQYALAPCNVDGAAFDDACAQTFIQAFGAKVFRRPLDAEELGWLNTVYQNTKHLTGITPATTFARRWTP